MPSESIINTACIELKDEGSRKQLRAAQIFSGRQKWPSGAHVSFQVVGKLLAKVAGQGKVYPSAGGCGLKSNRHNLSIRLNEATLSSAVEIAE